MHSIAYILRIVKWDFQKICENFPLCRLYRIRNPENRLDKWKFIGYNFLRDLMADFDVFNFGDKNDKTTF